MVSCRVGAMAWIVPCLLWFGFSEALAAENLDLSQEVVLVFYVVDAVAEDDGIHLLLLYGLREGLNAPLDKLEGHIPHVAKLVHRLPQGACGSVDGNDEAVPGPAELLQKQPSHRTCATGQLHDLLPWVDAG